MLACGWGGDDQPAAGSAAHVRDRVIFQQPHRFPKHRAAHLVAFQQRCLGPEDRPDLPAAGGDIVANGGRQHLGQLAAGRAQDQLLGPARLTRPAPLRTAASLPRWCCCSQPATASTCRSLKVLAHAESPAVTAATISECSLCT